MIPAKDICEAIRQAKVAGFSEGKATDTEIFLWCATHGGLNKLK